MKEGIIFGTYSSLISKSYRSGVSKTRLDQITNWVGQDFDGVVSCTDVVFFACSFV